MSDTRKFLKWANVLYWLTGAATVLLAAAMLAQLVLHPPSAATAQDYFAKQTIAAEVTDLQIWLAMAVGILGFAVFLWTLIVVRRLLDAYRKGRVLTFECAQLILRIGQGVALVGVLRIVGFTAQSVLLSMAAPAGQRALSVAVNSADIGLLLAGGLFTVIGWAMRDAAQSDAENKAFI